jgi:hypothetical protein
LKKDSLAGRIRRPGKNKTLPIEAFATASEARLRLRGEGCEAALDYSCCGGLFIP